MMDRFIDKNKDIGSCQEGDVLDSNSAIDDSEIDDTWEQMQLAARAPGVHDMTI